MRTYRVDFAKIGDVVPDFYAQRGVAIGAARRHRVFDRVAKDPGTVHFRANPRFTPIHRYRPVDQRLCSRELP
jgi:hypothetical protein